MLPAASLFTNLLLAISIAASSAGAAPESRVNIVTLPLAKHISTNDEGVNLLQREQARAAALKQRAVAIQSGKLNPREASNVNMTTYKPFSSYIASVGVGTPPTNYNLMLQLATTNTWIGADKPYKQTSTSRDTGQPVGIYTGSIYWNGEEWLDTVDLGSGLVVTNQSIGVANSTHGVDIGIDGVLGLGRAYLTLGTLWNQLGQTFPTVIDNLYNQATISEDVLGIFSSPSSNTAGSFTAELTFGGTDPSKYTGDINYVDLTMTSPSVIFWGIDQSISYGEKTIMLENAGIVDVSHTLIVLASDVYGAYKNTTGGADDATTGLMKLTPAQYENLENLNFHIGSVIYALVPNAQIWPQALNSYVGGSHGAIYSIISNLGALTGAGFTFILGQVFVERFYTVIDTTRQRIGFATTSYTNSTLN